MRQADTTRGLTTLRDDEALFRDSVYEFADREIRPLVREMDEQAADSAPAHRQAVRAGRDGDRDPRELRAAPGASFFHAVLAVEALSRVDPSVAVLVDVQNTLVINALLRWASDDLKERYLPRLAGGTVGAYALSEAGSGSDAFALATRATERRRRLRPQRPQAVDHERHRSRTSSSSSRRSIPTPATAASRRSSSSAEFRDSPSAKRKTSSVFARAARASCCSRIATCRARNVLGEIGKGYKVAIETLNEGRIGIGAQMIGLAQGALDHAIRYTKERKQFGKAIAEFQAVQFQIWPARPPSSKRPGSWSTTPRGCATPASRS